jgi:hypothetical protein
MNLLALAVTAVLPMLNPDGVPMDNGALDAGALLGRRALNTMVDKDVSFSATVTVNVEGGETGDILPRKEEFVYRRKSGWERFELDSAKISINQEPEEVSTRKRLQLEEGILLMSTGKDTSRSQWIYPKIKSCVDEGQLKEIEPGGLDLPKVEKEKLGDEVVSGQKCVKYKVKVHCFMGDLEGTRWEATGLQDLPIKTVVKMEGTTITTTLKDVKLGAPPAEMFTVPNGYKRYTSEEFFKYLEKIIIKEYEEKQKSK